MLSSFTLIKTKIYKTLLILFGLKSHFKKISDVIFVSHPFLYMVIGKVILYLHSFEKELQLRGFSVI